ncbi:hypothetical protein GUITHDRAFT_104828 [Guillardia theta CCMP2712]|uniref:Uncharacterized protein n=1 Tax=Guillardia theta (strain CCMP2712) TaxID=905079 RepID=L1JML5_GUITC|nr:hypothetical protein GUITHDRAFT_104828 [Guillardia theta CCMP2712]EKX49298.1 hypothetical protein GUITHDRAFT_104828 [Guillardia theta CCMP2712]|eukprot:XP_005836278.1 hypothetical protein GUITHDRAFT_104828 [Guillardia theta CCMP2712]
MRKNTSEVDDAWNLRELELLQQISMLEARLLAAEDASVSIDCLPAGPDEKQTENAMSNSLLQAGLLDKLLEDASKWRMHALVGSNLLRACPHVEESPVLHRSSPSVSSFFSPAGTAAEVASPSTNLKRQSLVKKLASKFQVFMPGRHSEGKKFARKGINKENRSVAHLRVSSPQDFSRPGHHRVALMPLQLASSPYASSPKPYE